jgi:hypothetical protein
MTLVMCVCCFVQDRKNRELGAENGQLQRRVLTLTEHERQLNEVSIINQQQQQQKAAASCGLCYFLPALAYYWRLQSVAATLSRLSHGVLPGAS